MYTEIAETRVLCWNVFDSQRQSTNQPRALGTVGAARELSACGLLEQVTDSARRRRRETEDEQVSK